MTRINVIPVEELTAKELGGEWKEIWRVFRLVKARVAKGHKPSHIDAPSDYTLGTGHVKFFYTRLRYIVLRAYALQDEMLHRGYSPNVTQAQEIISDALKTIPPEWFGDFEPTEHHRQINIQRMKDNGTR